MNNIIITAFIGFVGLLVFVHSNTKRPNIENSAPEIKGYEVYLGDYHDVDGKWYAQCVDLVKHYYKTEKSIELLGFNGSAIAGWNTLSFCPKNKRCYRTEEPEAGDIVFFGTNKKFSNGTATGKYGHVAIVKMISGNQFLAYSQNTYTGTGKGEKDEARIVKYNMEDALGFIHIQ